jgi:hypothetical protein
LTVAHVEHEAQLQWERRVGRLAAAAAVVAAVLLVAQVIVLQGVVFSDRPDTDRGALLAIDKEPGAFIVSGVLQALTYLTIGVVLWYLFKVTRYRRPQVPPWLVWLVIIGPLIFAAGAVLGSMERVDVADDFVSGGVTHGAPGEKAAEDAIKEISAGPTALDSAGRLAVALAFVMICINAMRAGVLSRFLGIIGVIVGGLYILPLFGGPQIVQLFWLGSVAMLFMGFWPGGRGPAWDTGEPDPWPTAAERRGLAPRRGGEEEEAAVGDGNGEVPEPEPVPERPASRKRKRKR